MARPAFEITDKVLTKVEGLAAKGLSRDQIAWSLGIAPSTLYKHKANNVELSDAIKRGEAQGLETITNALFERALGCSTTEERFVKNKGKDEVITATKYFPPDPTSCIFYLKCRSPSQWFDKPQPQDEDYVEPVKVAPFTVDGRKQNDADSQPDTN